jgi:hypothetical protein
VGEEALSFYAGGVLVRRYRVGEPLRVPWLSDARPLRARGHWLKTDQFDGDAMTITLWTADGRTLGLDMRTGGPPGRPDPWPVARCLAARVLGSLLFGLWLYRRR